MKSVTECYRILGIAPTPDKARIKAAFRKQAFALHPDTSEESTDSGLSFTLLRNAYETLMVLAKGRDPENLSGEANSKKNDTPPESERGDKDSFFGSRFSRQLNGLIWDIEDVLRQLRTSRNKIYCGEMVSRDILFVLVKIDKVFLMNSGLQDNFMTARKLPPLDPEVYLEVLPSATMISRHFPYTSVENYFFDIRMRMNVLIERMDKRTDFSAELLKNSRKVQQFLEAHQNCVYNVSKIHDCLEKDLVFQNDYVRTRELMREEAK